jgi:hypothetical protein
MYYVFSVCCLHQSLPGDGSQHCPLFPCSPAGDCPTDNSFRVKSQSYFTTDGLPPICWSWRHAPCDSRPAFFFQLNTCFHSTYVKHPLWREDGSVVYNFCWSSLAQSFSVATPAGLVTTFYCLKFVTPATWRAVSSYLYPPGTSWPSYTPRHWLPLSSPPTTLRATVEVFDPASTRGQITHCSSCPAL